MDLISIISLVVAFIVLKWFYKVFFKYSKEDQKSVGYKAQWYGKDEQDESSQVESDTSIRGFHISVADNVLEDLKSRLRNTRLEDPVEGSLFHYGFNPGYLKEVVAYWLNEFDWRKQENRLNEYPHYKTRMEGIDVHFMHIKPQIPQGSKVKVIPLMIIHGWPGSFIEFMKIIPLLTQCSADRDFVFEVVCPSIPGYGFSESPHRKGFNARACARLFVNLMERLEMPHFYVQGGDWGSCIASLMARYYAPRVLGLHVNMYFFTPQSWDRLKFILTAFIPSLVSPAEYKALYPLRQKMKTLLQESGYFHMQATKPDTLGCGMSDSPAGMAAYLLEKFGAACNPEYLNRRDGGLTQKFTMDELLTNVMVYWVNNNFTAAARFYKENLGDVVKAKHERIPITVPSGVALFPNEVLILPRIMLSHQMKDLVSYTIMERGGHFAALEEPQLLASDIWNFVGKVESRKSSA